MNCEGDRKRYICKHVPLHPCIRGSIRSLQNRRILQNTGMLLNLLLGAWRTSGKISLVTAKFTAAYILYQKNLELCNDFLTLCTMYTLKNKNHHVDLDFPNIMSGVQQISSSQWSCRTDWSDSPQDYWRVHALVPPDPKHTPSPHKLQLTTLLTKAYTRYLDRFYPSGYTPAFPSPLGQCRVSKSPSSSATVACAPEQLVQGTNAYFTKCGLRRAQGQQHSQAIKIHLARPTFLKKKTKQTQHSFLPLLATGNSLKVAKENTFGKIFKRVKGTTS